MNVFMWNTILFDLDGTLTASAEGITKSVQYALQKMGKTCDDPNELMCFVGPPLKEQFMAYAGFSDEEAEQAVTYYRERYGEIGIYENQPFPGIIRMLQKLRERGYTLAVASSKPTYYIRKILERYGMNQYFQVVSGSELDGRRTEKSEVIDEALWQLGKLQDRAGVVMVGDKSHDVVGAHKQQLPCIGVTFGYGSKVELNNAGADWIVDSVGELSNFLLQIQINGSNSQHPLGNQVVQASIIKKIWRSTYPVGIHFVGSMAASFGAAAFLTVFYMLGFQLGKLSYWDSLEHSSMVVTGIGNLICIPFALWCLVLDERKRGLWKQKKPTVPVSAIVILWLFTATFGQIASMAISLMGLNSMFPEYSEQVELLMEGQPFWLILLSVGILAPIAEELIFRGLVYRRVREYTNVKWGILLSSLIFGLYHGNMIQFIYAAIMGAVFAWLYEKTGRLKVPIMAHMAANIWSVALSSLLGTTTEVGIFFIFFLVMELVVAIWGFRYFENYQMQET